MNRRSAAATALLMALGSPLLAQDLIVRARTVVIGPDSTLTDGSFLVRQGKVAYVADDIPAEARANTMVADYGDSMIVPGFVLPPSTLGRDRDLAEGALAFTPDLRAAEAFDPWQKELLELPRHAITSLVLSPSPRNVAGGIAVFVKPGKNGGSVAAPEGHLSLSLTAAARSPERQPTSLMGAMDLLRTTFATARTGTDAGPDAAVLRQVLQGSRRAAIFADTFVELTQALELAKEFGFEPLLIGARDAEKVLPRLVQQKAALVLDTLRPEHRTAQLALPAALAEAGVPFCFGGRPEHQRLSAVLAVRAGLDRKTALQALTRSPAVMFGQQANAGALRQGCAADFAVFGGDPLDLDSKHVATWIDGVLVHGAAARKTKPAEVTAPVGENN
jgi:hypothetical protein